MENNVINADVFSNLSPQEKAYALKILQELQENGNSQSYENLIYSDYKEIPVDIDTFLHDPQYLGSGLITEEGKFTVFPYWVDTLKKIFPTNVDTSYNTLILSGAIGLGKAQPLNSLILTKDGFKKMGEITINDLVYSNDGKLHNIIGVYPQGIKKICKITFSDNTSTLCCDEHLWTVCDECTNTWITTETKNLISNINSHKYKIPITNPIEFEHIETEISSYTMGIIVGNMSLFDTYNDEIVSKVQDELNNAYYKNALPKYKFIPKEYLYNDINNRISLLQGLMDIGGYISNDGSIIEFTTISKQLKDDFVFLVQSLGGICKVKIKNIQVNHKNQDSDFEVLYIIEVTMPENICPFSVTYKVDKLNLNLSKPIRYIENIEYVGEDNCQCIYIDAESHLYLTNDFIVTHNTLMAVLCMLYMLYRMLCLKNPYVYYGLQEIDHITFSFMNITMDAAKGVAWSKLQELIQTSPWFMAHGRVSKGLNPEWQPIIDKGEIELIYGSQPRHVIGRAVFCSFEDEVSFQPNQDIAKQITKAKTLISSIDARMSSRFMKGEKLPTLHILASSKRTDQSFLETYIDLKKKNESKTTLIIDEPQWVIRTDKDSPRKFPVAVGNKFLESEVLPIESSPELLQMYRDKGYSILMVPMGYYETFLDDIDIALTDIAGISTSNNTRYINGVRWQQCRNDNLKNPFTKEIITVGNAPDDFEQYYDYFDLSCIPRELKSKPLYIHLDMSISGDKTGIAGVWIIGKKPHVDGVPDSKELYYQLAFSVSVKAPKGHQVSFEKNRQFIYWLKSKGFNIKCVSYDTYQSADLSQQLTSHGFICETISVDRVKDKICQPYLTFKNAIYEGRFVTYPTELLSEEIVGLVKDANGKIDHDANGINSKDQSDACCGATYSASQHAEEYEYNYGDDIDTTISVSSNQTSISYEQTQFDFQQELQQLFDPLNNLQKQMSKNDNERYNNMFNSSNQSDINILMSEGVIIW